MPRIPASASVVLAGLVPACAAALGLGDIQPKSFLNQPLAAEIPVHSDVPAEVAELSVTLASPETFEKFGLSHPSLLADLSFAVLPGTGGGVIRVTSSAPVAEPFLTLLLELRWPQGRLLREFTVLLDPPDFGAAVASPVARSAAIAPPAAVADAEVSRPVERPAESAPAVAAPAPAGTTAGTTHVVQPAETLWTIAEHYRPDPVIGINQMMLSIYRTNPGSFAGNINRLRAGARLQIPDRDAIGRLGGAEANAEVARQNQEWQAGSAAAGEQPARLELVPPQEAVPTVATGAQAGEPADADLRAELAESRRLLALKDSQLQALQQQLAALQGAAADDGEPPATAPATTAAARTAAPPAAKSAPVRKPVVPKAKKPAPAAAPGVVDSLLGLFKSIWLWIAAAAVLMGALLLSRRRGAGAAVVDDVAEDVPAAVAQRGSAAAGAAAMPVAGGPSMIVHEGPAPKREASQLLPTDEESPLERTIGASGMLDGDRSDSLAEADFHMAYGLYDQAADLLTAAVAHEPERRDLRLKLLDVLFVWENREAFLREARALRERLGEADPDWNRIAIMGQQICPGEKLFTAGAAMAPGEMDLQLTDTGGTASIDFNPATAAVDVLDFDIGEGIDTDVATQVARPGALGRTQEVPTIELPAVESAATTEVPTIQSPALGSTMETPTVEMPTGEGTLESPTVESWAPAGSTTARMPAPAGSTETGSETAEIELEDLGLDLSGLDEVARDMGTGLQEALPESSAITGIDFEFEETDIRSEGEESTAEMAQDPSLSHLALAMDRNTGTDDGTELIGDTAEQPVADLTLTGMRSLDLQRLSGDQSMTDGQRLPEDQTMTEVGTKLDLARAYADMGDPEGARSILTEVIEEGDEAQREEARQLLDGLDR